jgi:hypothetical protein
VNVAADVKDDSPIRGRERSAFPPPIREPFSSGAQSHRSSPQARRSARFISPRRAADISSLASRFLTGSTVQCDDPEALAAVVWELEDRLHATAGEPTRAERAIELARAQLMNALKRQSQERRNADRSTWETWTRQEYEEFNRSMAQREKHLEIQLREQVQQLRERQGREFGDHDAQWTMDQKQKRLAGVRPSRLLTPQRQLSGDSSEETPEHVFQVQAEFEASRALLDKKHAAEMELLLQACEVRRVEFRFIRDTLAKRFTNRFAVPKAEEEVTSDTDATTAWTPRAYSPRRAKVSQANLGDAFPLPPLARESPRKRSELATATWK